MIDPVKSVMTADDVLQTQAFEALFSNIGASAPVLSEDMGEKIRATFASPAGQDVLSWLVHEFMVKAVWPADTMGHDQLAVLGPFREGQKSVVAQICLAIAEQNAGEAHD